jgi:hypothetical protein
VGGPWQALVAKGRIRSHKLCIAVGRQIDRREGLVVQGIREGQRDGGYPIVLVIADVSRAWHYAAANLIYHVHPDARRGR